MIKIENIDTYGWETAIRGMRNPMNSWEKSDSKYHGTNLEYYEVGKNDLELMKKLIYSGDDHSKFMRMINVTADITAPLYWWKEYDTYKVGTVANSCSTMHKISDKNFTLDDFSHEHLNDGNLYNILELTVTALNEARKKYTNTQNKEDWWQMIQLLPSSYNQKRTVQLNYAVVKNIYNARKNHRLDEWVEFCDIMKSELPYFEELCVKQKGN